MKMSIFRKYENLIKNAKFTWNNLTSILGRVILKICQVYFAKGRGNMTKEEILEKSRKENRNVDMFDLEIQKKAASIAIIAAIFLGTIIFAVNFLVTKNPHYDVFILICGMESVLFFVKFVKMKKIHELIVAICYTAGFLLFTAAWIINLIG